MHCDVTEHCLLPLFPETRSLPPWSDPFLDLVINLQQIQGRFGSPLFFLQIRREVGAAVQHVVQIKYTGTLHFIFSRIHSSWLPWCTASEPEVWHWGSLPRNQYSDVFFFLPIQCTSCGSVRSQGQEMLQRCPPQKPAIDTSPPTDNLQDFNLLPR